VATSYGTVYTAGEAFLIRFSNSNTYDGKITLNINSQGAKDIWINGAVSSSSNKTLPAGEHWCFYDGSKFLIWTNGTVQFKGVHADSYEAKYILNANDAMPPYVTTGSIGGASADFVAPSHASNIPSSSYNWHIHAIIFRNGTNYRLTQIATASTSGVISLTYERNAWSSDGTTWTFATAWTEILTSNSTVAAGKISGTVANASTASIAKAYDTSFTGTDSIKSAFDSKLDKTAYEWNKVLSFSSTGKLCVGKFPMYDSNVTINISTTTSIGFSGTIVIATQNINTSRGGAYSVNVFGDPTGDLSSRLKVKYSSGSRNFEVYIDFPSYSKNVIHIQANALQAAPTDIVTSVDSIPDTDILPVTNKLTANFLNSVGSVTLAGGSSVKIGTQNGADVKLTITAMTDQEVTDLLGAMSA
jgi:hypothetical protein